MSAETSLLRLLTDNQKITSIEYQSIFGEAYRRAFLQIAGLVSVDVMG